MKTRFHAAAFLLAGSTLLTPVAAATLHVPSAYPTIQAALDAAAPGDTVKVAPGIYYENLTVKRDVLLIGSGWSMTILDGRAQYGITQQSGANITVDGFTIRNCDRDRRSAIRLLSSTLGTALIQRCRLEPTVPIERALKTFEENRFRHVPVRVGDGPVLGIVSDRGTFWQAQHGTGQTVRDAMVTDVLTGQPDVPIREVARVFIEERIGAMPIVDAAGALVGILTRSDILRTVVLAPVDLWA